MSVLPYGTIMSQPGVTCTARREFLKFLAASPYVAALGGVAAYLRQSAFAQDVQRNSDVIASPAEALDVLDFEEAAHRKVPPGHWAYMVSGVDDDATLRANREGYKHVQLRPRRLHDATKLDMRVELFGAIYNSPIFLCPVSGHKAFSAAARLFHLIISAQRSPQVAQPGCVAGPGRDLQIILALAPVEGAACQLCGASLRIAHP